MLWNKFCSATPDLIDNGNIISDSIHKAQIFSDYFVSQTILVNANTSDVPVLSTSPFTLSFIVANEYAVLNIIFNLDITKACGFDNVGNKLLKMCASGIFLLLIRFINLSLSLGKYPNCWKMANVIPIFKKENRQDKTNYRPISLLPSLSKDTLLPVRTKVKCVNDPPWISLKLKQPIRQRQKNLKQGNFITFRRLRNEVNRERKSCRSKFYDAKVKELKESAPNRWWKEVKKLSGMSDQVADPGDVTSLLRNLETDSEDLTSIDSNPIQLANLINKTFLEPMQDFNPLSPSSLYEERTTSTFHVSEYQIFKSLSSLRPRKATGPDGIPGWVLRENADILARPISGIINQSYRETHLPESWKCANIAPIPKEKPVRIINKHLRPISLTPIISKIAESFVVDIFVKPAVIKKIDQNQFGTIPNSSTVHALISMLHEWNGSTDGNGGTTRVVLFDFRKAFDLIDHHLLVQKLKTYDLPPWTIDWITDFITCRKQRVKLNRDCYSDWELVPAGVPQGTMLMK